MLRFRRVHERDQQTDTRTRQINHATCDICRNTGIRIYAKASMLDKNTDGNAQYRTPGPITDNDLKYRSHRALTCSFIYLTEGLQGGPNSGTMAQWWRSCWWKKPGVQAACTDRSRVPDTRRVPVRSRGARTFVQIEAGGFYPRFYGKHNYNGLSQRQLSFLSVAKRGLRSALTTQSWMRCV